jgi:hypothetical protein
MLRATLGASLLLAWSQGLAAQAVRDRLLERSRGYIECYEIRLFEWSGAEGRAAAESIPNRVRFTASALPPRNAGSDASAPTLDFVLAPAPSYSPSNFEDERWSLTAASDSVTLTWSGALGGVRAVLAVVGAPESWTLTGRTESWTGALVAGQPASVGRVRGRSVDCEG